MWVPRVRTFDIKATKDLALSAGVEMAVYFVKSSSLASKSQLVLA